MQIEKVHFTVSEKTENRKGKSKVCRKKTCRKVAAHLKQ
jgi:hypothetical protein